MLCIVYGQQPQGLQILPRPMPALFNNRFLVKVHCARLNPVGANDVIGDKLPQYPAMIQDPVNGLVCLQDDDFVYRRLGGASLDWIRAGLERTTGLNCWKNKHEKLFWIRFPKLSHELRQLQEWAESGKLTVTVSNVFDFDFSVSGVRAAFEKILSRRTVGKVVVRVLAEEDGVAEQEQELPKKM